MIKPNELRCGNTLDYYLNEDGIEWHATNIDAQDILWLEDQPDSFNKVHRPIPLTEEWLLRFGFEYEKQTIGGWERWEIKTDKGNRIKILDKKFTWGVGEYSDYILYVHQLQNLYFALTGTELELKEGK